ncbi:Outer membrane receptor proteins, mostly Fe transport [Tangfeifania diversioriginum]|uniref:Outer membrane receptor proteins, mostly Fe transport n=1 Tax=Tangfeifania diversioriginum TaxID=1168035 RepID=A0A1M6HTY1_9BACT|nr:carboxypeptidase-like regulatory domain-containing protein [Tangfeifania diversioriginum]SHJ25682.1 Outer membrane receptor proteins, mostly Fe transport [Tangfeifania diversioriginum]
MSSSTLFKSIILNLLFSFGFLFSSGQDKVMPSEKIAVEEFIQNLEIKYNVKFYFQESALKNKKVNTNCSGISLDECLEEMCNSISLEFYRSGDRIFLFEGEPVTETLGKSIEDTPEIQVEEKPEKDLNQLKQQAFKIFEIGTPGKNNTGRALLRGHVTSYETGDPVYNANVILAGTSQGVSTNQNGYFEIRVPVGNNTLQFSSIGMEPTQRIVNIYSDGVLNVQMETQMNIIGDVDVLGEQNGEVSRVFSGVERFEGKMLESLPALLGESDVIKSTLMLPGVSSVGEGTSGFNVRGGKTDQNLILIDNAPVFYPSHFFGNFSAINSDVVEDAVLYKGSIPSKYGGRISSVYEINTKTGKSDNISGVGGVGLFSARLMLEGPLAEKSSFVFSTRGTYSDWVLSQINIPELYNSEVGFNDVQGKVNFQLNPKNHLTVGTYLSNDKFKLRSDTLYRYKNLVSSALLEHEYNKNWKSEINLSYSNFFYNISGVGLPSLAFEMTHDVAYHGFKNYNEYSNNGRFKTYFGLESVWYKVNPGDITGGRESEINSFYSTSENAVEYGVFAGAEFSVTPLLSLETGIRWSGFLSLEDGERFLYAEGFPLSEENITDTISSAPNSIKKHYNNPEFRLSANYMLSQNASLKFSYNKTTQYIHMLTNTTAISPTDTWKLSDEYLPPQVGNQFSVGVVNSFWQNAIELTMEGYYKKIKNIKEYKPGASLLLNDHIETEILNGLGKAYGAELSIKKNGNRLTGWLAYTWSRILIKSNSPFPEEEFNDGEYFPASYDKPHNLNLFANLKASRRLLLSTTLNYATGRPITLPVAKYRLGDKILLHYSDYNQYRIPDYFRIDLSVTLKGSLKADKLFDTSTTFSIYNLTGRKNAYSVFYKGDGVRLEGYKLSIFGSAIPTLTFNFNF